MAGGPASASSTAVLQQLAGFLMGHGTTAYVANLMAAATARPLDVMYSRFGGLSGSFFNQGWGNLGVVNLEEDVHFMQTWPPRALQITWKLVEEGRRGGQDFRLFEGSFKTPCTGRIWDELPPESRTGRAQLLVPRTTGGQRDLACVVHLAATGDQHYRRRLRLAFPLLHHGVAALVLESPFYGSRRPAGQVGAKLRHVSDLLVLGWTTIAETLHLLHWAQQGDFPTVGVTGLSMGGVHACMSAGLYQGDASCAPLLAPRSAAVAYCDGALRHVTAWPALLPAHDARQNEVLTVVAAAARAISIMRAGHHALQVLSQRSTATRSQSPHLPSPTPCPAPSHSPSHSASATDADFLSAATDPRPSSQPLQAPASTSPHEPTTPSNVARSLAASTSAAFPEPDPHAQRQPRVIRRSPYSLLDAQAWDEMITPLVAPPAEHDPHLVEEEVEALLGGLAGAGEPPLEALHRLKGVLEAFTDVTRYPRPRRPEAAVLVAAEGDEYVSLESVQEVHRYWGGSELRRVPGGHVSAFLMQQNEFRRAVLDSLHRVRHPVSAA